MNVQKTTLLSFLNGYKKANQVIRSEKRHRLQQLTTEDSLREFESLWKIWCTQGMKENGDRLEKSKIEFLIWRRSLMNRIDRENV